MKKKKGLSVIIAAVITVTVLMGAFTAFDSIVGGKPFGKVRDTIEDGGGKKARVILLAGQSNASGCSLDEYLQKNVSEEKYGEYQNGYDNVYINYVSGANESNGFVKCKTLQGELEGGFGPELGIAEKLSEQYPDETFFIIKCAWGATALFNLWLSPSSWGIGDYFEQLEFIFPNKSDRTGQLYRHLVGFAENSIEYLKSKNYDVKIEALCWMQGEADSFDVNHAVNYEKRLNNFIKDVRRELAPYASSDGIAFIDAHIADNPVYWVYCDEINASKDAVKNSSPINALIDTNKEGLTCENEPEGSPDMAHYDSLSEIKLGNLFAGEAIKFFD